MAVKIRLQRQGNKNRPYYRIVVADARSPRDGRFVEVVGTYDPINQDRNKQVDLKIDRADYWLGVGAQPSDTARTLINRVRREATAQPAAAQATTTPAAQETPAAAQDKTPLETPAAVATVPTPEPAEASAPAENAAQQAGEAQAEQAEKQAEIEQPVGPAADAPEANATATPPAEAEVKAAEVSPEKELPTPATDEPAPSEAEKKQD